MNTNRNNAIAWMEVARANPGIAAETIYDLADELKATQKNYGDDAFWVTQIDLSDANTITARLQARAERLATKQAEEDERRRIRQEIDARKEALRKRKGELNTQWRAIASAEVECIIAKDKTLSATMQEALRRYVRSTFSIDGYGSYVRVTSSTFEALERRHLLTYWNGSYSLNVAPLNQKPSDDEPGIRWRFYRCFRQVDGTEMATRMGISREALIDLEDMVEPLPEDILIVYKAALEKGPFA